MQETDEHLLENLATLLYSKLERPSGKQNSHPVQIVQSFETTYAAVSQSAVSALDRIHSPDDGVVDDDVLLFFKADLVRLRELSRFIGSSTQTDFDVFAFGNNVLELALGFISETQNLEVANDIMVLGLRIMVVDIFNTLRNVFENSVQSKEVAAKIDRVIGICEAVICSTSDSEVEFSLETHLTAIEVLSDICIVLFGDLAKKLPELQRGPEMNVQGAISETLHQTFKDILSSKVQFTEEALAYAKHRFTSLFVSFGKLILLGVVDASYLWTFMHFFSSSLLHKKDPDFESSIDALCSFFAEAAWSFDASGQSADNISEWCITFGASVSQSLVKVAF